MRSLASPTVDIKNDQPVQASALPLSDKPVTLSFKGTLGQKPGLNASTSTSSAKAAAPAVLGFSLHEEDAEDGGDEDAERSASATDKGLSHALRCEKMHWWMCVLTCHTMQLLSRRKLLQWLPARRYVYCLTGDLYVLTCILDC